MTPNELCNGVRLIMVNEWVPFDSPKAVNCTKKISIRSACALSLAYQR